MQHSELHQAAAGAASKVLLARGSVAGPLLLEAQRQQAGTRLWLHLDPAARTGMPQASCAAPVAVQQPVLRLHGSNNQTKPPRPPACQPHLQKERLSEVPCYAHPKWIAGEDGSVEALEVQYLTLYAFNGAYNVGGLPFIQTGAHDGDWEHCTARSVNVNSRPEDRMT